jgi:hypothetical protein
VAVLPQDQGPLLVVDGEHDDRPGVLDDQSAEPLVPAGGAQLVPPDDERRPPAVELLRGVDRPLLGAVRQPAVRLPAGPGHTSSSSVSDRRRAASPTGISSSFWRATAAPTSPANIGCARVGRDRSSGWAWVET